MVCPRDPLALSSGLHALAVYRLTFYTIRANVDTNGITKIIVTELINYRYHELSNCYHQLMLQDLNDKIRPK